MDSFAEDTVTPIVEYQPLEKKLFKPWHKPRKQWCRFNQWVSGLNWVVDTADGFSSSGDKTFNYLGLPGDDLLDLRLFAASCKKKGVPLKYLGFNTASSNELRLSESELHKTGSVAPGSKVITEPLESLARKDSSAFIEAKLHNGFHMVNFDLCKSIAKNSGIGDTYLNALVNILELQSNNMREPWTLFITTYACKQSVINEIMTSFLTAVKENNDSNPSFSSKLKEELFIKPTEVERAIKDLSLLSDQEFFDLFALGFSKWLLMIYSNFLQTWSVEMTQSCKYRTGDYDDVEPNMLSLAFRFKYIHQDVVDPYCLTSPREEREEISELDIALNMLTMVTEIFNLDLKLLKDKKLEDTLITTSADLLVDARYDREKYIEWVNADCPTN